MSDFILKTNINISNIKQQIDNVIKHNNISNSLEGKSTTGENCAQYMLLDNIHQLNDTINVIKDKVKQSLIEYKIILSDDNLTTVSAWTVFGYENCFHKIHKHNEKNIKHVATVLYLQNSDNTTQKPGSIYAITNGEIVTYDPIVGDILIFPTHLLHGTYPQGYGLRQTLNIDFKISR
jgi:hypothetical protein